MICCRNFRESSRNVNEFRLDSRIPPPWKIYQGLTESRADRVGHGCGYVPLAAFHADSLMVMIPSVIEGQSGFDQTMRVPTHRCQVAKRFRIDRCPAKKNPDGLKAGASMLEIRRKSGNGSTPGRGLDEKKSPGLPGVLKVQSDIAGGRVSRPGNPFLLFSSSFSSSQSGAESAGSCLRCRVTARAGRYVAQSEVFMGPATNERY